VATDNTIVQSWANLHTADDSIIRKVIYLSSFDFKLFYLETRLQPADLPSRMCPDGKAGEYTKRFLEGKIINARGKDLDLKTLLCKEVSSTLERYFSKNKRESQSVLTDSDGRMLPSMNLEEDCQCRIHDYHNMDVHEDVHEDEHGNACGNACGNALGNACGDACGNAHGDERADTCEDALEDSCGDACGDTCGDAHKDAHNDNKDDASTMENGHKTHTNADESTQANALK
jgi:hypothetical protein